MSECCETTMVTMFVRSVVILLINIAIISDGKSPIYLLGLYPMTGDWAGGQAMFPASEMAIMDINANESILAEYELRTIATDTKCLGGTATDVMYKELYDKRSIKTIIMGGGCSVSTIPTAEASKLWNLIQISFSAYHPSLSDRSVYPLFFRMAPSASSQNLVVVEIIKYFGWKKVATINPDDAAYYNVATLDFRLQAKASDIDVIVSESFENDPTIHVQNIKRQNARIIVGNFWEQDAIKVMCAAYKEGLYGSKYVWILPGWYPLKWWQVDNSKVNCSIAQLDKVVEGYLAAELGALVVGGGDSRVSGMSDVEYSLRYNAFVNYTQDSLVGLDHGPYGYDVAWAVALALDNADKLLKQYDPPSSLLDFNYTNANMTMLFYEQFSALDFEGISGRVQFTSTGDRLGPMRLRQLQNGIIEHVGFYDPGESGQTLTWTNNPPVYWENGKPPADSFTYLEEYQIVSVVLFIVMTICALCGIILAVSFLIFNIACSNRRIIKMSSPRLNNLIIVGGLIVYLSTIFLGLDVNLLSLHDYEVSSKVFTWCLVTGFSLGFGAMFSKTWRVHRIFTQKKPAPLRIRDSQLVGQVAAVVFLDLAILSMWELCDPRRASIYKGIVKADPKDDDIIITEIFIQNVSTYQLYWIGALFIINGLLLIFGAFLAWETRNITMPALNDSKLIGMSVYTVVIISFTGVPVSFVVEEPNSNYALLSSFIFFSTTVTLCLVFIPKIRMRNEVYPMGTMASIHTEHNNQEHSVIDKGQTVSVRHF